MTSWTKCKGRSIRHKIGESPLAHWRLVRCIRIPLSPAYFSNEPSLPFMPGMLCSKGLHPLRPQKLQLSNSSSLLSVSTPTVMRVRESQSCSQPGTRTQHPLVSDTKKVVMSTSIFRADSKTGPLLSSISHSPTALRLVLMAPFYR